MIQRTEIEQARADLLKVARASIRLKYSLLADQEINDRLPELEAEFNRRVAKGQLPAPSTLRKWIDA